MVDLLLLYNSGLTWRPAGLNRRLWAFAFHDQVGFIRGRWQLVKSLNVVVRTYGLRLLYSTASLSPFTFGVSKAVTAQKTGIPPTYQTYVHMIPSARASQLGWSRGGTQQVRLDWRGRSTRLHHFRLSGYSSCRSSGRSGGRSSSPSSYRPSCRSSSLPNDPSATRRAASSRCDRFFLF